MEKFQIPAAEQLSDTNQALFGNLKKMIGFVPNLYAVFAHSEHALGNYLALQSGKSSLNAREREVINLVVSQYNQCAYCLSAHTAIAKMNGFTDAQILEIRQARISFDTKLDALAKVVYAIVANKGHAAPKHTAAFYAAGYHEGNLVDALMVIGDKIITNYLFALSDVPIDWPVAPEL